MLSLFVDGQLALTEWAIIQGHLLECPECRKELDRVRGLAGVRARAHLRRTTAMTAAAMAVVLAVAAVGGAFIYRGSFPELPSWGTPWGTPPPPRVAIPPAAVPAPVAPVPLPAPFVRSSPPPPRAKGTGEAMPRGTAPPAPEPAARATRPAATAQAPTEDRMPTTQARPPVAVNAPPDAEAMPTEGPSRR